jgi:dihydroorotase
MRTSAVLVLGGLLLTLPIAGNAQEYDRLLKVGHVIDSRNGIDRVIDVAIQAGVVAPVDAEIPPAAATRIVDASGMYVTPGFVHIHSHNYYARLRPGRQPR